MDKILESDLIFLNNFKKYIIDSTHEQNVARLIGQYLNQCSTLDWKKQSLWEGASLVVSFDKKDHFRRLDVTEVIDSDARAISLILYIFRCNLQSLDYANKDFFYSSIGFLYNQKKPIGIINKSIIIIDIAINILNNLNETN
tara:strand:- start:1246 stop:1671 length:426 start_codon:yes stop_codon:yes gene_type:complete